MKTLPISIVKFPSKTIISQGIGRRYISIPRDDITRIGAAILSTADFELAAKSLWITDGGYNGTPSHRHRAEEDAVFCLRVPMVCDYIVAVADGNDQRKVDEGGLTWGLCHQEPEMDEQMPSYEVIAFGGLIEMSEKAERLAAIKMRDVIAAIAEALSPKGETKG